MTAKEKQKQARVEELMRLLECTQEEALDVIATDEIIDKGGRTKYDLSKEQEKLAMKMSAVSDRTVKDKATNNRGKARAENPTKSGIITELVVFLEQICNFDCENIQILNKERQIGFQIGEDSFELTLVLKRKPKK